MLSFSKIGIEPQNRQVSLTTPMHDQVHDRAKSGDKYNEAMPQSYALDDNQYA